MRLPAQAPVAPIPADDRIASRPSASAPDFPLAQLSVFDDLVPESTRGTGASNQVQIQPVFPIPPLRRFPIGQIVRPSLPIITTTGPDRTSELGDLTLFDIFLPERRPWGSCGVGPVFVFPTATDERAGQGKWQLGPAAALLYDAIPHLQLGAIVQNPISFAGDDDRDAVNAMLVQPIAQYNLECGWYVGIGDMTYSFDWREGGNATIPLAAQVGRVVPIVGQQWNLAVEPFYLVVHEGPSPRWGIRFGLSLLLPE